MQPEETGIANLRRHRWWPAFQGIDSTVTLLLGSFHMLLRRRIFGNRRLLPAMMGKGKRVFQIVI